MQKYVATLPAGSSAKYYTELPNNTLRERTVIGKVFSLLTDLVYTWKIVL